MHYPEHFNSVNVATSIQPLLNLEYERAYVHAHARMYENA